MPPARRTSRRVVPFVVLAILALFASVGGAAVGPRDTGPSWSSPSAGADRLLVRFRAGVSPDVTAEAVHSAGASERSTIPQLGVHVLTVPGGGLERALATLKASPHVEFAEADGIVSPQEMIPNDPFFPQQFALAGGAWGWFKTRTTQAWDITRGDPSVVVAVLDTGLKNVADFAGQTVTGWNVMNNSTDTSSNAGNHGTYVAGVVGLALGNGVGNAGYCPRCKVMPVQVGTDSGATWSDIAAGITWAADHGARVENLSWAGTSSSSTLTSAVSYARSKGVVVVAAAGNTNCDCPNYPAATPGVVGVAGTDTVDNKQGDSNFGSWVMVAAPEGNMTAWPSISGAPGYAPVGGTSLASPVVAGIAGLLFSYNTGLTGSQVEQALESSAVPVSFSVKFGRVDALAALSSLGASDPQPPSAPVNTVVPQLLLSTNGGSDTAPLTAAPQVGQVLVRGQGAWTGSAPLSLSALQWQRCDASASSCTTVGTSAKYTAQSADSGYALRFIVTVKNGLGSTSVSSPLSLPVGGSATASAPVNSSLPTVSGTAQDGQTLSASTGTWSGSPTAYAYQWLHCDLSGGACASIAGATGSTYALTNNDVGFTIRVTVTASNSAGSGSATSAATQSVLPVPVPPSPSTQTLTFSASLNTKNQTRTFSVTVGAGLADARLSFSKCSTLSLALQSSGGSPVDTQTGPSVIVLDATLSAGTYSYVISGGRCSFALTVTSPSP